MIQYPLTLEDKQRVRDFLSGFSFTPEQYDYSYPKWGKSPHSWDRTFQSGGTDIVNALMWYHHVYKPDSKEYRAKIIMNALVREVDADKGVRNNLVRTFGGDQALADEAIFVIAEVEKKKKGIISREQVG